MDTALPDACPERPIPERPGRRERFLFLPSFGFVLLIIALGSSIPATLSAHNPQSTIHNPQSAIHDLLAGIGAAVVVLFGINTWQFAPVWGSDLALAQAMVRATSDFAMAHNRLGVALRNSGNAAGAESEFRTAVRLKPDYAEAHDNLGSIADSRGDINTALTEHRLAVQYDPLSRRAQQSRLGARQGR